MSSSINSGYTKRHRWGSPLVKVPSNKSSSVHNIEKLVEEVNNNTLAEEEVVAAEAEEIVADGQSNINSTQLDNVPPKKLKVAIKTRLIELTNEIERIQKPLRPSSRVKFTSEWLHPSSSEADESADTPVEDDQPEINSTIDSDKTISSDDDNTFGSHNTSDDDDDDDYATALRDMTLDDFMKEVNRRRKVREAKVNNAESIDTNNNDSTENSFNIDNDNNTASTSDIVDKHDTVNDNDSHTVVADNDHAPALALPDVDTDNENNPPSTANRLAGETRRNVRASTRVVSRPHYTEPSLKSKLRREDVDNASTSACNVTQPIPQSIFTRGSRVGRKARNTTTCYKEPSSKTKLRREP